MIYTEKKENIDQKAIESLETLATLEHLLIFDIETTGFHRQYDKVIAITILIFEAKVTTIRQWFSESPHEEKDMLMALKPYFDQIPVHMTYNGHSFDIPFLISKYNNYNISIGLNKSKCYDLYRFARKALDLESYKLKQIEQALNIERSDMISGKECTELYNEFLQSNDVNLAHTILKHNYEDVLNLVDLFPIIERLDDVQKNSFRVSYFAASEVTWYITSIMRIGNFLEIKLWGQGDQAPLLKPLNLYFDNGGTLTRQKQSLEEWQCELKIPCYDKALEHDQLVCVDLSRYPIDVFSALEPYQHIVRFNDLWLHDHIMQIAALFLD